MNFADTATTALGVTAVCAVLARLVGALSTSGAVAGAVIGACVSAGFGLPGLAVLGTFFVVGTLATRIGWKTKKARGTAEAGEGRRDWKRVVGKGGVAGLAGLLAAAEFPTSLRWYEQGAFAGAVAAALADTLGTEIGTLHEGRARMLPTFRAVPTGTPGAVSGLGTGAAALGAAAVAGIGCAMSFPETIREQRAQNMVGVLAAGLAASLLESVAVGAGLRAPGFVRNLLTTSAGALLGGALAGRAVY
jgi:uncharacterized protein (TIGR00297 family)